MTTYSCSNKRTDGSIKKQFIYYRCPAHIMRTCPTSKQFNQKKLEEWLLQNLQLEAEKYNRMIQDQKKAASKKNIDTAKIMAKLEKLKDLYLNDLILKEAYEKEYVALTATLNEAKQQTEYSPKELNTKAFKNIIKSYNNLSEESKKAFWSRTIKKIIVSQEGEFSVIFHT